MALRLIRVLIFPFEWDKLTLYWTSFSHGSGCSASATPIKPDSQEQRGGGGGVRGERGNRRSERGGWRGREDVGGVFPPWLQYFLRWSEAGSPKTEEKKTLTTSTSHQPTTHFQQWNDECRNKCGDTRAADSSSSSPPPLFTMQLHPTGCLFPHTDMRSCVMGTFHRGGKDILLTFPPWNHAYAALFMESYYNVFQHCVNAQDCNTMSKASDFINSLWGRKVSECLCLSHFWNTKSISVPHVLSI